jgi:hypothetical protein
MMVKSYISCQVMPTTQQENYCIRILHIWFRGKGRDKDASILYTLTNDIKVGPGDTTAAAGVV